MNRVEIIEKLAQTSTGNIADSMDNINLIGGGMRGSLKPINLSCKRTAGSAITIKFVPKSGRTRENTPLVDFNHLIDDIAKPGDIIVADVFGLTDFSVLGGLMALRAKLQGVNGLIINGAIRDVEELTKMEMPAYTAGTSPYKCRQEIIETAGINVDVEIDGVRIVAGDYIVMEETGIVVVPKDKVEEIFAEAQKIIHREEQMEELLKEGMKLADAKKTVL